MDRRRRVNRLKKIILGIVAFMIVLPTTLSILFGIRMHILKESLHDLERLLSDDSVHVREVPEEEVTEAVDTSLNEAFYEEQRESGTYLLDGDFSLDNKEEAEDALENPSLEDYERIYEELSPESTGSNEVVDEMRRVYLTFDDGPSNNTEAILDILDEYGVKATFFVVGKTDEHSIAMYKEIVRRGHTLGMHSFSHVYDEIYASKEAFTKDLDRIESLLYGLTGERPTIYRFPGGSSNRVSRVDIRECIEVLNERGIRYFDWNSQNGDAVKGLASVDTLLSNALRNVDRYQNVVILMHDANARTTTVESLPKLIEKLQAMDNTVLLPITDETVTVQHVKVEE